MLSIIPGSVVEVCLPFGIKHRGIITELGTVVAGSKRLGRVSEEDIHSFTGGRPIHSVSYPSNRPPSAVVQEARSRIGEQWELFSRNCQHFTKTCHGLNGPTQIEWVLGALAVAAVLGFSKYGK